MYILFQIYLSDQLPFINHEMYSKLYSWLFLNLTILALSIPLLYPLPASLNENCTFRFVWQRQRTFMAKKTAVSVLKPYNKCVVACYLAHTVPASTLTHTKCSNKVSVSSFRFIIKALLDRPCIIYVYWRCWIF